MKKLDYLWSSCKINQQWDKGGNPKKTPKVLNFMWEGAKGVGQEGL